MLREWIQGGWDDASRSLGWKGIDAKTRRGSPAWRMWRRHELVVRDGWWCFSSQHWPQKTEGSHPVTAVLWRQVQAAWEGTQATRFITVPQGLAQFLEHSSCVYAITSLVMWKQNCRAKRMWLTALRSASRGMWANEQLARKGSPQTGAGRGGLDLAPTGRNGRRGGQRIGSQRLLPRTWLLLRKDRGERRDNEGVEVVGDGGNERPKLTGSISG